MKKFYGVLERLKQQSNCFEPYYIYILLHDWEGNIQFEAGSIGPSAARDNTEAEN